MDKSLTMIEDSCKLHRDHGGVIHVTMYTEKSNVAKSCQEVFNKKIEL